jgi:hypothetical protein
MTKSGLPLRLLLLLRPLAYGAASDSRLSDRTTSPARSIAVAGRDLFGLPLPFVLNGEFLPEDAVLGANA